MTTMTHEQLESLFTKQFPAVQKAAAPVKTYPTFVIPEALLLTKMAAWLKDEMGFTYLDMVTAVDYSGPVEPKGYVMDPNPNHFLPEGATPQVEAPVKTPGFNYRDTFELVYCLSHLEKRIKVFLKLEIPRTGAKVPSLVPLFKTADWQEREVFDLLGIEFKGHPNLTKILTPDFIQGHPLRKDYVHVADRFD